MAYILTNDYPELKEKLNSAIDNAAKILKRSLPRYASGDVYEAAYKDGKYTTIHNGDVRGSYWTEGFWTGQLWLAYEATGDDAFKDLAQKNVDDFYKRVVNNYHVDWHHDTGFLYIPTCVASYMLTGNETAKKAALMAATSLSRRFRIKGEFIQNMSTEIDDENYRLIVDTLLNVPLLFWATRETGDPSYQEKAMKHIRTTIKYAMREDGTSFHHVLFDTKTGDFIRGLTLQGAGDNSCWSRGQAWVVYGLALAYGHTKDESLLEHFVRATDYFVDHLPSDYVPYWDFVFSDGDDEPRDSVSAAIAACGIMEMANHLPKDKCNMQKYLDVAAKMIESLAGENYAVNFEEGTEGLVKHATGSKPHNSGVDTCISFSDYYYLESLIRATRDWKKYW